MTTVTKELETQVLDHLTRSPGMSLGVLRRATGLQYMVAAEIVANLLRQDRVWFRENEHGLKFWFPKLDSTPKQILNKDGTLNVWCVCVTRHRAAFAIGHIYLFTKQFTGDEALAEGIQMARSLYDETRNEESGVEYSTLITEHEVVSK